MDTPPVARAETSRSGARRKRQNGRQAEHARRPSMAQTGADETARAYLRLCRSRFRRLRYLCRVILRRRFLITELMQTEMMTE